MLRQVGSLIACLGLSMMLPIFGAGAGEIPLMGAWRIHSISGVMNLDQAMTSFEVNENGQIVTTVGCNRIMGKAEIAEGSIKFGSLISTRMACPGPLEDVETKYLLALDAARSYSIDDDQMQFRNASGAKIVVFFRTNP